MNVMTAVGESKRDIHRMPSDAGMERFLDKANPQFPLSAAAICHVTSHRPEKRPAAPENPEKPKERM
jgi:hypothetical protein